MRKAITHLKSADPVLSDIIERVGACKMTYREPTFENLATEAGLELLLNCPLERPRPEVRIVADQGQVRLGGLRQLEADVTFCIC